RLPGRGAARAARERAARRAPRLERLRLPRRRPASLRRVRAPQRGLPVSSPSTPVSSASGPRSLPARAARFAELERAAPDVLVIGGGITGAGLALDLAARGLRTALVERDDWAAGTSSASSRLIHGGLRYLEQLEVGLVRDSCLERGLLLRNAAG